MNRFPRLGRLAAVAGALAAMCLACGSGTSSPEVPDEPYEPEPTGENEAGAVLGPGPDSTEVEGVRYPHSEQREGYESEGEAHEQDSQ